ncbi:hypothetical protein CORC01_14378 [Colletotrichum orchidophilum]|uniref:Uncharacterized protein n=1 Tax=Colletotrichum orchidophilum TaxID=1209926 RepID=A0A1G4AMC6_9PEZI|nr:uncharacterized protein CORC01_14378 [Colletotrichum orchidophilum]OHE90329.1 hypothetical protein CORC01_14378 [Colletotrichum orchidophilum]
MHFPSVLATLWTVALAPVLVLADNADSNCPAEQSVPCNFGNGVPRCLGVQQRYYCLLSCPKGSTCPSDCEKAGKGGGWCAADNGPSWSGDAIIVGDWLEAIPGYITAIGDTSERTFKLPQ